jgi:hypothetical protein
VRTKRLFLLIFGVYTRTGAIFARFIHHIVLNVEAASTVAGWAGVKVFVHVFLLMLII